MSDEIENATDEDVERYIARLYYAVELWKASPRTSEIIRAKRVKESEEALQKWIAEKERRAKRRIYILPLLGNFYHAADFINERNWGEYLVTMEKQGQSVVCVFNLPYGIKVGDQDGQD